MFKKVKFGLVAVASVILVGCASAPVVEVELYLDHWGAGTPHENHRCDRYQTKFNFFKHRCLLRYCLLICAISK